MTRSFDVAIVGAGPAGSTAARVLAEGGARVVVLEKGAFPRMKVCGGGVVRRAAAHLPDGFRGRAEREIARVAMRFLEPARDAEDAVAALDAGEIGSARVVRNPVTASEGREARTMHAARGPASPRGASQPLSSHDDRDRAASHVTPVGTRDAIAPRAPLAFEVARSRPIVSLVMRCDFDAALADAAARAGAELRFGTELVRIGRAGDGLELGTSHGSVAARFVIGADGALGTTAKLAGWREPLATIPALEAEIELAPRELARFEERATFDFGAIDSGYAWLFPKSAHLSAGVLTTRRGPARLRRELERYLAFAGVGDARSIVVHGSLIPVRPRVEGVARERVLLVGDAAGLADPLTLEGISIAMRSASICAESILDGGLHASETYARRLRAGVLVELACARKLAWLVYEEPGLARALFSRAGQPLCEAMADVIAGERTYRELLAHPSHWWGLARSLARRRTQGERV